MESCNWGGGGNALNSSRIRARVARRRVTPCIEQPCSRQPDCDGSGRSIYPVWVWSSNMPACMGTYPGGSASKSGSLPNPLEAMSMSMAAVRPQTLYHSLSAAW